MFVAEFGDPPVAVLVADDAEVDSVESLAELSSSKLSKWSLASLISVLEYSAQHT